MKDKTPEAWNAITRITHWLITVPVTIDFFVDGGDLSHKILGYLAFAVTVLRLGWGFVTKDQANFSAFPLKYKDAWNYIKYLPKKKTFKYPGHNPLAAWVYLFMWGLVIGLGVSGYMMGLDAFWGESWLEELHETMSNALMFLVILHFIGMGIDSWKFQRKTWLGMITGKKP